MALELLISAPVHAKRQYPEQQLQAATEQVLWFDLVERSLAGCLPVAINVAGLSTELSCWRDKLDPDTAALFLAKVGSIVGLAEDGRVAFTLLATDLLDVETVHMRLDLLSGVGVRIGSTTFEFRVQGVD
jgi:hypothetical protein